MNTKHFSAPWGPRIWWITGGFFLLGLGPALAAPWLLPQNSRLTQNPAALWIAPLTVAAIIGGTAFWVIRGYEITEREIIIRRSFWSNRIPLHTVISTELDPHACRGAWKRMGNDGLFAMHGSFQSKRLGKFQAYVTHPAKAVIVRTSTAVIVLSPDNPGEFVRALHQARALHNSSD